jgi:hypothetical protein
MFDRSTPSLLDIERLLGDHPHNGIVIFLDDLDADLFAGVELLVGYLSRHGDVPTCTVLDDRIVAVVSYSLL